MSFILKGENRWVSIQITTHYFLVDNLKLISTEVFLTCQKEEEQEELETRKGKIVPEEKRKKNGQWLCRNEEEGTEV